MFPCMPKDILVSNVTQNYKTNKFSCSTQIIKFIWLILSTINYNSDITLFLILRSSQGSEATHCRCGGKYDTDLVANLLLSPTLKNFFLNRSTFIKAMGEYRLSRFYGPRCMYIG